MKHRLPPWPMLSLLGLVWGGAGAAHITDKLAVGLYGSAAAEQPARILTSGTPVEILERGERMCRVQLGDGDGGWLECRYLSDEKPARVMLVEAQARAGRLWDELAATRATVEKQALRIGELERRLQATEGLLAEASHPANAQPAPQTTEPEPTPHNVVERRGTWISAAAGLLTGLSAGAWLMRRRIRKRFRGLHV